MLKLEFPIPVKFICGFIYPNEKTYSQTKKILAKKFGKLDLESEKIIFNYTSYYYPEMGKPLFRRFISFQKLKNPAQVVNVKLFCLKTEKRFAKENRRTINIDPGYLNESKLVLTTTKDFSHRVYLGRGIFAETTLFYQKGKFRHFPFSFPDYRTQTYKEIFEKIRNIYSKQIKD